MTSNQYAIGIDIGGTKIAIAIIDGRNQIVASLRQSSGPTAPAEATSCQIAQAIERLRQEHSDKHIRGIGIAVAGQVTPNEGIVSFAPNLSWHNVPLGQWISEASQLPTVVTNDVRAATFAEWQYGAGKGHRNIVCIFVGTGIGSGIVINGQLLAGSNNCAGEIGHMIIDLAGRPCHCGNLGCFEALAGGRAIGDIAWQALLNHPTADTLLHAEVPADSSTITISQLTSAAKRGDLLASQLLNQLFAALAAGIANIVNFLNPECIVLGGGVIEALDAPISTLTLAVKRRALHAATETFILKQAALSNHAVTIGAAQLALSQL
jgi:glucokinase